MDKRLEALLEPMQPMDASDLHLVPHHRPTYRVHGDLIPASEDALMPEATAEMIASVAPPHVHHAIEQMQDCDFAVALETTRGTARFRANVGVSRGLMGACFRAIPATTPTLPELGFPSDLGVRILKQRDGLVLVTGVTGSGKTTTLAALIQMLNTGGGRRIITIEEPVEYLYEPVGTSIITQREVGTDVPSFYEGLRSALRQDPDVILVGEIRDQDTARLAISAAETGHLIFATMHTRDAKGAITRLVDLFPVGRRDEIRTQLSLSLRFAVTQHLLPSAVGGRRVLAVEAMYGNFGVRSAIRHGKIDMIDTAIQNGRQDGMFSLDTDLHRLLSENRITVDTARKHAQDPTEFGG